MQREIIFWQNNPSVHQSAIIWYLAAIDGNKVMLVNGEAFSADHKSMGCTTPDFSLARLLVRPGTRVVRDLIAKEDENRIDIFSGLRATLWSGAPSIWLWRSARKWITLTRDFASSGNDSGVTV